MVVMVEVVRWRYVWLEEVRLGHQPVRPSGTERALLMMDPAEVGALLGAIPPHPAAPSRAPPLLASWLAAAATLAAAYRRIIIMIIVIIVIIIIIIISCRHSKA
ncbi:hypothetical protein VOLCADRAFT_100261 [Volvox carteri f. nagariensis]|uniref:Uncharacterized protein n=1 Tax=Volvox carteri f. nagariensis TaxID=3068 RepID=D8UJU9_VOLCA|nr:uncharacterized protein VOLCADRAFT_100261 [Volvox carteri f. nagariensis]EFJ40017.1 hypothetical protein VOLCADRAFT_100261 [Volvox carteri f. nagariensis]|eukprot:XP_002958937.1 hypothetical protein VOLCADRAFT_100261 [Volvox carteri f. nagariensis]